MPLSENTASALSLQRNEAWRTYRSTTIGTPRIWSSVEDWQWFVRNKEQDRLNTERKKQWATRLRFTRPDIKPTFQEEISAYMRRVLFPQKMVYRKW